MFDLGNFPLAYMLTFVFSVLYAPKTAPDCEMPSGEPSVEDTAASNGDVSISPCALTDSVIHAPLRPKFPDRRVPAIDRRSTFQDLSHILSKFEETTNTQLQDPMLPTPVGRRISQANWWRDTCHGPHTKNV